MADKKESPEIVAEVEEVADVPAPGLGRVVLYVTVVETIRPAIITAVNEDGTVDVTLFNSEGAIPVTNVPHAAQEDLAPGTYHWPHRG